MRRTDKVLTNKIQLPFKITKGVLAVGPQTKNTLCFAKGSSAFLTPVLGDLDNPEDYKRFEQRLKYFLKKQPRVIAYDLHPEYQSTKHILDWPKRRLSAVQHHHAHIASCMAQNSLKNQRVIGVAFDGTGLGEDNSIWGAEFFVCDYRTYQRVAHLKEILLLGGERAVIEPWRLAVFWLHLAYKESLWKLKIDFVRRVEKKKWQVLKKMSLAGFNSPRASSMGRFFDVAASMILAKTKAAFEAELAIELERLGSTYTSPFATGYKFNLNYNEGSYVIDPLPMFRGIVFDLRAKIPREKISYKFHLSVAEMLKVTCLALRRKYKLNRVVLSGGVFQNKLLLRLGLDLLCREGFKVFTSKKISCNDSGISLGEAVIAAWRSDLCV